jgi:hypothetical protein
MKPISALLRRYSVTLFLAGIAVLATTTIAQTVRLRYLEQRHHQMLSDFGKTRFEMQNRINELAAGCATPARN